MDNTKLALLLGVTLLGFFCALQYITSENSVSNLEDLELRISLFSAWKQKYNKTYSIHEIHNRFFLWNRAYDYVQQHNLKGLSWKAAVNQFADLSDEEFNSMYLGNIYDPSKEKEDEHLVKILDVSDIANNIDWRQNGAVTSIKNQGKCGSCYTFSSAAALEGLYYLSSKKLVDLSEQQILDCSQKYGNSGCNGGWINYCYRYVKDNGIEKKSDYDYTGEVGNCSYDASKIVFKNTGYFKVARNNPDQLKVALNKQPVSVAVQADQDAFRYYTSGVISDNCGPKTNHAVLAVGYAKDYWIVKNSWGTDWGEQGYVRIAMGRQNNGSGVCGINDYCSYPTGSKDSVVLIE